VTELATIPAGLAEIAAASPETLGLLMLQDDPHGWRLDQAAQSAAVGDALAEGTSVANALQARFLDRSPSEMAHALGVAVETTDDDPMTGSLWRFAEYRRRPPTILLYSRGLAPLERADISSLVTRLLGPASAKDVFVAHELFHHAEASRPDIGITQRHRPTLFRIGGWRWRTGIAALSEIAAGAFAQALLGLPCHPKVLDLMVLDAVSAQASAARIASRIATIAVPDCDSRRSVIGR
jgi:hypothetical protein